MLEAEAKQVLPKVIWEEPRRSPQWLQWDAANSPLQKTLPFDYLHHPFNTPILDRPHSPA